MRTVLQLALLVGLPLGGEWADLSRRLSYTCERPPWRLKLEIDRDVTIRGRERSLLAVVSVEPAVRSPWRNDVVEIGLQLLAGRRRELFRESDSRAWPRGERRFVLSFIVPLLLPSGDPLEAGVYRLCAWLGPDSSAEACLAFEVREERKGNVWLRKPEKEGG